MNKLGKNNTAQSTPSTPGAKPAHGLRLGAIKAALWENRTDKGIRHNVTFRRLYKDGEQWKSSDSFGRDDLLTLAKLADQAHSWIHDHYQSVTPAD